MMKNLSKSMGFAALALLTAQALAAEPEFFARKGAPGQTYPFSEAVQVGQMLYLSGDIGIGANGKIVEGGVKAETKQAMDNIGANLARHHSSFDQVVQCTVALADIAEWPAFNEVYKGYFSKHFPARMAYAASGLALGARVEVQCNATVAQ
ncbi:Rid family hydrolase [Rudaea sp.]|jgi:reactive intermediate/imine deaminase|uniref:Rid family hydrolase n=1 Tax=Rudaea sp. TaxID=2136325 RepID=UPI002F93BC9A